MSPRELFYYRQVTKYTYNNINLNTIYNKIITIVEHDLKTIMQEKYNQFIELMKNRKMIITDPYLTEIIWGDKYNIIVLMREKDMGTRDDNVFLDYKSIDPNIKYDPAKQYDDFQVTLDMNLKLI